MSTLDTILGGLGGALNWYLGAENIGDVKDIGQNIYGASTDLGSQAYEAAQFEPFTVTGSFGGGSFDPNSGNISLGLNPAMQASSDWALGLAGDAASRSTDPNFVENRALQALNYMGTGAPVAGASQGVSSIFSSMGGTPRDEQYIYGLLENMQTPGREREKLELENRLFGQGRLGVKTDAYGGTPEQLAMAKAHEESRATNAFNAYRLAQDEDYRSKQLGLGAYDRALAERGQNIGIQDTYANQALNSYRQALAEQGMLSDQMARLAQMSFLPQQMLMNELGLGLDAAQIAQTGRLGGAQLGTNLAQTGLDALVNSESIAAGLQANLNKDLTSLLMGDNDSSGILSAIADLFS